MEPGLVALIRALFWSLKGSSKLRMLVIWVGVDSADARSRSGREMGVWALASAGDGRVGAAMVWRLGAPGIGAEGSRVWFVSSPSRAGVLSRSTAEWTVLVLLSLSLEVAVLEARAIGTLFLRLVDILILLIFLIFSFFSFFLGVFGCVPLFWHVFRAFFLAGNQASKASLLAEGTRWQRFLVRIAIDSSSFSSSFSMLSVIVPP